MSVRKRQWTTGKGVAKEAWVVDYADANGKRRLKTFPRKKEADNFASATKVEVRQGLHVADRESITIEEAGELWLAHTDALGLERATRDAYRQHLTYHIAPLIGRSRLSRFNVPDARAFEDRLRDEGRSPAMVRRVMRSLGSILADSQEHGLVARNVARELRSRRGSAHEKRADKRQRGRLKIGEDIPTPAEIRSILNAATGHWKPLLMTAALTGLRASEIRGLRWSDLDLAKKVLHVRQRADRYNQIGQPKSEAGEREIPLPPSLVDALASWQKEQAKGKKTEGKMGLVFPTGAGNIESLGNIINRGLHPAQLAAGVTVPSLDKRGKPQLGDDGQPMVSAKYTGMHALRHFFASWCINRRADGGLELPAKVAQERLGHASIVMTLDTYGHLFPRGDDLSELAIADKALFAGRDTNATREKKAKQKQR